MELAGIVSGLDAQVGNAIDGAVMRHHERRLRRIGWEPGPARR